MLFRPFCLATLAVAGAALLSACAEMKSIAALTTVDGPPTGTYTSGKPPAAVVDCLQAQWSGKRIMGATGVTRVQPVANGFRMSLILDEAVDQELLIEAQEGGSATKLWTHGKRVGDKPKEVVQVEGCQ